MSEGTIAEPSPYCSAADVRRALSYLMPHLQPFWAKPLRALASDLYDVEQFQTESVTREHAMGLLRGCIERAARRAGVDDVEARNASQELAAAPVMQTGPHALLLVEPDAFYTHLFSLMGLIAHGRRWHITYSVSTSAFKESAKKGPGWLRIGGETLNLFGIPRRRLIGSSIGCLNGPYRFALSNSKGRSAPNAAAARLLADLPDTAFPSGAEAIRMGNQALWRRRIGVPVNLLQLDDFDMADLIADHLEDEGSWMSTYFAGGGIAEIILDATDRLNSGRWSGWVRRTTDLFWRVEEHRILPMRLQDGVLTTSDPARFELKFTPDCLAAALRARAILPAMFTGYLVVSILPGVRALGGCRQTVYLPLMRFLTSICADKSGDTDLLASLRRDDHPGVWGHRVLRPEERDPFQEIEAAGGISPLLAQYAHRPLEDTCGDLASFTTDPIWAEMSGYIADGTLTHSSDEWKWSGC